MRVELVILCPTCTQLLLAGKIVPGQVALPVGSEDAEVILARSIVGEEVHSDQPWVFITDGAPPHPHPVVARVQLGPEAGVDYDVNK